MHDGSLAALDNGVDLYDRGGNRSPLRDGRIHRLDLSAGEKHALAAFLRTLSGAD